MLLKMLEIMPARFQLDHHQTELQTETKLKQNLE